MAQQDSGTKDWQSPPNAELPKGQSLLWGSPIAMTELLADLHCGLRVSRPRPASSFFLSQM